MMKYLVVTVLMVFAAQCHSQVAEIAPVGGTVAASAHLVFPTLPLGYRMVREPMALQGQEIGFITTVSAEDQISKVLAKVNLNKEDDFSKREYRVAAFKGYVNGFADSLREAGYKAIRAEVPNLSGSDIVSETAEFEFVNDQKGHLWIYKRVFFDSRGFDIMVIADSKDSFAELKAWAAKITASEDQIQEVASKPDESTSNGQHADNVGIADLQGEWTVEAAQIGKRQFPIAAGMPQRLLFNDNILAVDAGEKKQDEFSKLKIELVGGHPVQVNFVRNRKGNEEVLPGILEITDGKLRVALPLVPVQRKAGEILARPSSFDDRKVPFMLITSSRKD